ncbi:transcriptional regulator [Bacillus thuringiensis serovar silo]|uniref:helix-turn-helix domain-containing protein n=1 Tax=Bacillus thuringiensis TaxID=1428 RepID=UPI000A36E9CC|nr:helix-turn-helix transcriptional regulator [Bacillus thuringiensis]MED3275419.1 helix-turn-helix transcriptional regulator [Bacillus thuringiensis]OTW55291.1 transcriptional regulator [Bacillus thuringiensis serovar silo]OTW74277.1 transcriptional regulator [Bacillus thuringiensis serovar toguchini]
MEQTPIDNKRKETKKKKSKPKPQPHPEFIEISQQLRKVRESKGLTLVDASQKIGIGFVFLSEIERALKAPSSDAIEGIARTYEMNECDIATAYRRVPNVVLNALTEHKKLLYMIYDISSDETLSPELRKELFDGIIRKSNQITDK